MYKQKLIALLKSVQPVKEAMEKLEFGCIIKNTINNKLLRFVWYEKYLDDKTYCFHFSNLDIEKESFSSKYETKNKQLKWKKDNFLHIIWLPLQERFIRMYCENKNILIYIRCDWLLQIRQNLEYKDICKLDNTKDFDNQDDLVYQKIYEALLEVN